MREEIRTPEKSRSVKTFKGCVTMIGRLMKRWSLVHLGWHANPLLAKADRVRCAHATPRFSDLKVSVCGKPLKIYIGDRDWEVAPTEWSSVVSDYQSGRVLRTFLSGLRTQIEKFLAGVGKGYSPRTPRGMRGLYPQKRDTSARLPVSRSVILTRALTSAGLSIAYMLFFLNFFIVEQQKSGDFPSQKFPFGCMLFNYFNIYF